MTADEFRKILDRFHQGLRDALRWKNDNAGLKGTEPWWHEELEKVWRDLDRECALAASEHPLDTAIKPTRPLPDPPSPSCPAGRIPENSEAMTARMPTAADENAEQIGKLQGRIAQLEGALVAVVKRASELLEERDAALLEREENMTWDYKAVKVDLAKGAAWNCRDVSCEMIDRQLAEYGSHGWELVTAFDLIVDGHTREVVLLFKRLATSEG